jgi:endonuclease YncB( thermonuclease family)
MNKEDFRNFGYDTPEFSLQGKKCWARCVSIYDGDTCTLVIPFQGQMYRFSTRLHGIDTSEMKSKDAACKERALKARNRLLELVTQKPVENQNMTKKEIQKLLAEDVYLVWIECFELEKYGRVLLKMYVDSEEAKSFGEILVEEKLAYSYFGQTKMTETEQAALS